MKLVAAARHLKPLILIAFKEAPGLKNRGLFIDPYLGLR